MQLSQAGTDKNPLQNRIPGITHILQLVMTRARILGKMDYFYFLRHMYETCL
jgi:hypothetical protein